MTDGGTSEIFGVPAGLYEVHFTPCGYGGYLGQWWQDAATQAKATAVTVQPGNDLTGSGAKLVGS